MIKGIIWDIDGVVLDSMGIWPDVLNGFLGKYGRKCDDELLEFVLSKTFRESAEYVREHFNLEMTNEEVLKGLFDVALDFYTNSIPVKEGVRDFLDEFRRRGIRMAVATASDRSYLEPAFRRLGLMEYFDSIFTCVENGTSKEYPDIYYLALESLGLGKDEVVVFEDSLYAIKTCYEAGFNIVGVYDSLSAKDSDEIKKRVNLYLENYNSFDLFLNAFNL